MARNSHGFGRLLTAAAVIGAAAAGTWYYLKKKDGSAAAEKPAEDDFDEYEDYDKFEDEELDDIPASSAPEDASETEAAGTNPGRSYVSLDLKKAKERRMIFSAPSPEKWKTRYRRSDPPRNMET